MSRRYARQGRSNLAILYCLSVSVHSPRVEKISKAFEKRGQGRSAQVAWALVRDEDKLRLRGAVIVKGGKAAGVSSRCERTLKAG